MAVEGIALREERPWVSRKLADSDAEGNRENLLRIIALKERLPELIVVPAQQTPSPAFSWPTLAVHTQSIEAGWNINGVRFHAKASWIARTSALQILTA